jgi:hypothetical protein
LASPGSGWRGDSAKFLPPKLSVKAAEARAAREGAGERA